MPDLTVNEIIRRVSVEEEITRQLIIPADLRPAERIVSANARVRVTSVRVVSNAVEVNGIIRVTIFYVPEGNENLQSFTRSVSFTERLVVPGARPGLDASIDALVSDIDWDLTSPRTIVLTLILLNQVELFRPERVGIIEERERLRYERYRVQRVLQEFTVQRSFTRSIVLESDQPDIARVISIEPAGITIDAEVQRDRIIVEAFLNIGLLYRPVGEFELRFTTIRVPLRASFAASGVRPGMDIFINAFVQDIDIIRQREREIVIRIETIWEIVVITEEELEIPTDIIEPGRIPVRREFLIERIVVQQRTRIVVTDIINLDPEEGPCASRVLRATGRIVPGSLNTDVERGGITISGSVVVDVLYVSDTPEQQVFFTNTEISFTRFLDIEGIRPDMEVRVEAEVDEVRTSLVDACEIRVAPRIDLRILVTEKIPVRIIEGIGREDQVPPAREEPAGTFIYTVQQGDTLFKIAQRYNTTIETLVRLNNLEDPDRLFVGQRLLIPR